jgi:hypothetical protein
LDHSLSRQGKAWRLWWLIFWHNEEATLGVSVLSAGVSAFAIVQGERRARAAASQRMALGPGAQELRAALTDLRTQFGEIGGLGGVDTRW